MGCGRPDHWFKVNPECVKKMKDKMANKEAENQIENTKKSPHMSFFAQWSLIHSEPNPVIDSGASTSIGGIFEASAL